MKIKYVLLFLILPTIIFSQDVYPFFSGPNNQLKIEKSSQNSLFMFKVNRKNNFSLGIGVNLLPLAFYGYGGTGWVGYKRIRVNFEYFNFDVPSAFFSDNRVYGGVDNAFRIGLDYFIIKNLSSLYLPVGAEFWESSVEVLNYNSRVEFESIYLSFGIGYLFKIFNNIYFDSRFSMGVSLAGEGDVSISDFSAYSDAVSFSGFIGIGLCL